jgi:hypothetical protein
VATRVLAVSSGWVALMWMFHLSRTSAQYITSQQDRGNRRHLLVGVVLQASLVEVGISGKEAGNNAGPIRESQTGSGTESETGVGYGIGESGQTGQTN